MQPGHPLTGLVIAVPEAEPVVGSHRIRPAAGAAHRVTRVVGTVPRFSDAFRRTAWFADRALRLAGDEPNGRWRARATLPLSRP